MIGRVVKIVSNQYTVAIDGKKYIGQARGKFRLTKNSPVVGDEVEFDLDTKVITSILPRINKFDRPPIANIYYTIVVASLKKPDLDLYLLDKMLVNVENKCQDVIILFTKLDLCNLKEQEKALKLKDYYSSLGYMVVFNKNESEIKRLKNILKGRVVSLTGQSGAGKSTFLNMLDPHLNLATNPISEALNRGVHTTRHVEIYDISGIYFIDTPGFSALDLTINQEELKASIREFKNITCKYKDCNHDKEDECLVKEKVKEGKILPSRYNNYILFKKEIYENSRKLYK